MTKTMMDAWIMNDDDDRNRDDHVVHRSTSSTVNSSSLIIIFSVSSFAFALVDCENIVFTERNTLRPVILSFSLNETRKNIIKYLKNMEKLPKFGPRSHPPSFFLVVNRKKNKTKTSSDCTNNCRVAPTHCT